MNYSIFLGKSLFWIVNASLESEDKNEKIKENKRDLGSEDSQVRGVVQADS